MWTAQEISKLRQYLQMTQAEFADKINTNRRSVIRWENDQSRPNYKAITELNRLWGAIPKADRHTIKPIWYYSTNSFGDFLWVKVAQKYRNGRWSKWYWYPVDKVSNFHSYGAHTLVFQTIGHFEYQDTQSKQLSNLAFDWDVGGENVDEWKKNFSRCRHSTLLTIRFFLDLGLEEPEIRVFFSGGRSYHLEAMWQSLGIEPQPFLNETMKALAMDVNDFLLDQGEGWFCLEIDDSLYANPKMYRLPNSRYPKGKEYPPFDTYKIELAHEEVEEIKTIDELWELSKKPRPPLYDDDVFLTYKQKEDAVFWYQKIKEQHEEREKETIHVPIYNEAIKMMDGIPMCIASLRQVGIFAEGTLNKATMLDACYCKDAGIPQETAQSIINTWSQNVNDNLTSKKKGKERERHVISVVKSVYSDNKYKFSCGLAHKLGLPCDSHNCPLHGKYDLRKHGKNIRIVENIQFDDDDTHIVNTILEARAYIAKKIDLSVFYQRDAIFTSPPGIGKTTTGIQTLEPILPRFIYAGPRHENCDYVVEKITQKDNWTRILPRRPRSAKPKDPGKIAQWKAGALCPFFELADKLASLRYNVGKILCAEGKEGKNPNWCAIPKEECEWWNQFITDKSASIVHEYLFIPTLMDLLIGKYETHPPDSQIYSGAPAIIFDEPSPDTFIETVIISTKTMTKTIEYTDYNCIRELLQLLRKVVEDNVAQNGTTALYGNAVMKAIIDTYDSDFENLLLQIKDTIANPTFVLIKADSLIDATDKAYLVSVLGKSVWIPKEWEISMKSDNILFRVPPSFAEDKNIMSKKNDKLIVHKEGEHELILQFMDDLVKKLSIEYERFFTFEPYNSAFSMNTTSQGPSLVMRLRKNLQIPTDVPLLVLDANGDAKLLSHLTGRELEEYKVSVKMNCRIVQVLDGSYGITTLYNKKEKKPRKSFYRLVKIVSNIAKTNDPNTIFICTWKVLEPYLLKMIDAGKLPKGIVIDHYGDIRGSNEYENRSIGIMLGTPCPPPEDLHTQAQCEWYDDNYVNDEIEERWIQYHYKNKDGNGYEIKMKRYKDPRMEMLRRRYQEMEIYHAAHRIRPLLHSGRTIYLLTNLPIKELPPDEMPTVTELTDQTDPKFQEFERKMVDFVEQNGAIWLKQARKFTDVTLWKLTRWFDFVCKRNKYDKNEVIAIDQNTRITVFSKDEVNPDKIKIAYLLEKGDVKGLRELLGITQKEFAEQVGYSLDYIKSIEVGRESITDSFRKSVENIIS